MAEVAACCILKCAGTMIPLCIPQDVKDKLTRPVSYVLSCRSNVKEIKEEVEKLKGELAVVQSLVNSAKCNYKRKIKPAVDRWLTGAEKITLRYDTEIQGKLDGWECNSCFSGSLCEVGKMLDDIEKLLEELKDFGNDVSYVGEDPFPARSIYQINDKRMMSRGKILKKIWQALEDSSNKVIHIYGFPGAGKTALLEMLVKSAGDTMLFHCITAVTEISETPDIYKIQNSIARRINVDLSKEDGICPAILHRKLQTILEEQKRILVVLDDVCTEDIEEILKEVGIPFKGPSCTILMSSRRLYVGTEIVGEKYIQLDCLDEVEAMDLFRESLGSKIDKSEKYTSMENAVLQKCHGLPSAITEWAKVITRRPNVDYQLNNLHSSEVNGVNSTSYRSIRRSYDLLKRESCDSEQKLSLQKFFLLSCLFPQGTTIAIEDLIRYGIGISLFGENTSLDYITRQATGWVGDINALSLFERKDDSGRICINNFIREVTISIASQEKYLLLLYVDRLDSGARWMSTEKYTIISMNAKSNVENNQELLPASHYFQDLHVTQPELKALHLTKIRLSNIPQSKHLGTLSVEYCEIEDASLIKILTCLKVLSLRGSKVENFPGDWNPKNLNILDLTECRFGEVIDVENLVANPIHLRSLWELYLNSCSCVEDPAGGVVTESMVGISRSLENLYALEIEIPRVSDADILLGKKLQSFKIAIGCKVPSSFKKFYFYKQVLLFENVGAEVINSGPLRELLEKTECLSLVRIENLQRGVYDLNVTFLHLKCLHISHCNKIEIIVCIAGLTGEILPDLEILSLEQLDSLEDISFPAKKQIWCSKLRELKLLHLKKLQSTFDRRKEKPQSPVLWINHACNLAVVEIRDCESLQNIFSPLATTEIDFPCLKKLELQRLSRLEGLILLPEDGQTKKLFHDKMNFPALQELYLSSLDNVKKLWDLPDLSPSDLYSSLEYIKLDKMPGLTHVWNDDLRTGVHSFGCLKKIEIIECEHLESLCPPTVAALRDLESLEITSCDKMVEVIKIGANANNVKYSIWMQTLKLEKLSSLQCFYQGSCIFEFQSLKELFLSSLPKMFRFPGPQNLDTSSSLTNSATTQMPFIEIEFPSLEHLELHDMHEGIEKLVEEGHDAFPELKTLSIKNLGLKCLPGTIFEKLEGLEVCGCQSLQGLQWTSFPNLRSLVIRGSLLDMVTMVSSIDVVQGKGLPKLEHINIEDCEDLEEIVSKVGDNVADLSHGTHLFPHLKQIELRSLAKFRNFSSGRYTAKLPALEKVEINGCPNLKKFSPGELVTPKLKSVQVDHKTSTERDINLNSFLEDMNKGLPTKKQSMDSIAGPSWSWPRIETSDKLLQDSIQELSGSPEHEITERNLNTLRSGKCSCPCACPCPCPCPFQDMKNGSDKGKELLQPTAEQSMDSIAGPSRLEPHIETPEKLLQDLIQESSVSPEHEITERDQEGDQASSSLPFPPAKCPCLCPCPCPCHCQCLCR